MQRMLFIADVHLAANNDRQQKLFTAFLDRHISPGDGLYIIGDLFDYWANNSAVRSAHAWVFDKLERLCKKGCRVGLLIGNRDFLLRKSMVERFGIAFLDEEAPIEADGKKFFLAHGHTLCLSDTQFLRYRSRMWPLFRALDRLLPGWIENKLAARFQQQSKKVINAQDQSRFQFTRPGIEEKFKAGFDYVICGHTHKPESFCSGSHCFHALPAWEESSGNYLEFSNGEMKLHFFHV
jgi:UDP-2,3-diacylglucosamine hydrolase